MAGRSGIGAGVGILIAVLGVLSLTLFVLTIVFWSNASKARRELQQATADSAAFISAGERAQDEYQRLKDAAQRAQGKPSVISFLNTSMRETMQRVTGTRTDGLEQLNDKLKDIEAAGSTSLLSLYRSTDGRLKELEQQMKLADEARARAEAALSQEIDSRKTLETSHGATIQTQAEQINTYKGDVEKSQAELAAVKSQMDQRVTRIQDEFASKESELKDRIASLSRDNLRLNQEVSTLRGQAKSSLLKPADESTLVDGQVVGLNQSENEVYIGLGRQDKLFLGMTFAVYNDGAALRPDPITGDLPAPKAQVEVTNVGETSSTARIRPGSERKGNPVVRGDVLVNAVYDPKKTYSFVVYGNFDPKGSGRATEAASGEIEAMIAGWGGEIQPELNGNVDFLVLGQRPVLPPDPKPGAPVAVVQEYNRQFSKLQRYDTLIKQAQATSLPVLNENRLYTLIGR